MKISPKKSKRQSIRDTNKKDGYILVIRASKYILRKLAKNFAPEALKENVRSVPLSGDKVEIWCKPEYQEIIIKFIPKKD